jgi:hypothetical protein
MEQKYKPFLAFSKIRKLQKLQGWSFPPGTEWT